MVQLRERDAQIDASIERGDAGARQIGLGVDELDGRGALRVEQLTANAIAFLGGSESLGGGPECLLCEQHRLLRGEELDAQTAQQVVAIGA